MFYLYLYKNLSVSASDINQATISKMYTITKQYTTEEEARPPAENTPYLVYAAGYYNNSDVL